MERSCSLMLRWIEAVEYCSMSKIGVGFEGMDEDGDVDADFGGDGGM